MLSMDEEEQVPFKNYFPKLSLHNYFWVVILVSLIVFGVIGYFVGIRVSELPFSSPQQQAISPTPQPANAEVSESARSGSDNDGSYLQINGSFVTKNDAYKQFVITAKSLPYGNITAIDMDTRSFMNPVVGVQYPYFFSRLFSGQTYAISASFCHVNTQTYALECANNIKITKCSGAIQGKTCIIKSNGTQASNWGEVDFSVPSSTISLR
jgi:hypothetical protein